MRSVGGRVGIKEVAQAAGVSVTTVSHALSGKGRLPEDTRQRVRRIAAELGYRPNAMARNLAGGRTGMLGLAVSQPGGLPFRLSDFAYFAQLMAAATTAAMNHGYALVLTPPNGSLGVGAGLAVDGAIIVDPVEGDPLTPELRRSGVPVVTTGRVLGESEPGPWVDNDQVAGTRSVLDHLARRGARRIALLTSPTVMSYTRDVEHAYRAWCTEHRMDSIVEHTRPDLTESAGYAAAGKLLDAAHPPDAIYATYDRLAAGTLLAAQARGVTVPHELLLVTAATESGSGQSARPSLTALNLHPDRIGHEAAELLVALVDGRQPRSLHVTVPTRVIARASTRRTREAVSGST